MLIWSLSFGEEHILRVIVTMFLRRIFVSKTKEVTGECIKLLNEELHNFLLFSWVAQKAH
jgi:hypothetical protein